MAIAQIDSNIYRLSAYLIVSHKLIPKKQLTSFHFKPGEKIFPEKSKQQLEISLFNPSRPLSLEEVIAILNAFPDNYDLRTNNRFHHSEMTDKLSIFGQSTNNPKLSFTIYYNDQQQNFYIRVNHIPLNVKISDHSQFITETKICISKGSSGNKTTTKKETYIPIQFPPPEYDTKSPNSGFKNTKIAHDFLVFCNRSQNINIQKQFLIPLQKRLYNSKYFKHSKFISFPIFISSNLTDDTKKSFFS